MRKLFVILLAVVLAFGVALGDSILENLSFDFMNRSDSSAPKETKPVSKNDDTGTPSTSVIDLEPTLTYQEHLDKGDHYFERGFYTYSTYEYTKAAKRDPSNVTPYLHLMEAHFELGNYSQVLANADTILGLQPTNQLAPYYQVLTAIKQSHFDQAEALIQNLFSNQQSVDKRLYYYAAILDVLNGRHEEAQKRFNELPALLAGEYPDYLGYANEYLSAYEEYGFAQAAEADYLNTLLARAFNKTHQYEMTIYLLRDLLKNRSDLRDAWVLRGFAYLNLKQTIFALNAFEQAYKLDSQWAPTQYFLGLTYADLGRADDAIIYLNYALNNGFEPAVVIQQKLADLYLDAGRYEESVQVYEELLGIQSNDVNQFIRPVWIYLEFLHQPEKALPLAESAVRSFPESAMSYNLLGWSELGLKQYRNAEANLKRSIQLDPVLPAPYFNLARVYEANEQLDLALEYYQKAFDLDQNGSIGNQAAKAYNRLLTE